MIDAASCTKQLSFKQSCRVVMGSEDASGNRRELLEDPRCLNMVLQERVARSHIFVFNGCLIVQGNLALTYQALGRLEPALPINRDVFLGFLKLYGEEHSETLREADNYALLLLLLKRYREVSKLLRKLTPVARRVLGEGIETTLRMRWSYAEALYKDDEATLDDLREAVTTLEEIEPIARREFGEEHLFVEQVEYFLRESQGLLHKKRKTEATPSPRNSTLS